MENGTLLIVFFVLIVAEALEVVETFFKETQDDRRHSSVLSLIKIFDKNRLQLWIFLTFLLNHFYPRCKYTQHLQ